MFPEELLLYYYTLLNKYLFFSAIINLLSEKEAELNSLKSTYKKKCGNYQTLVVKLEKTHSKYLEKSLELDASQKILQEYRKNNDILNEKCKLAESSKSKAENELKSVELGYQNKISDLVIQVQTISLELEEAEKRYQELKSQKDKNVELVCNNEKHKELEDEIKSLKVKNVKLQKLSNKATENVVSFPNNK